MRRFPQLIPNYEVARNVSKSRGESDRLMFQLAGVFRIDEHLCSDFGRVFEM